MKNTLITALALVLLCSSFQLSFAQESKNQLYYTIESEIIPEKVEAYKDAVKKLANGLKEGGVDDISWHTVHLGENRFVYLSPIKNMAALDNSQWAGSVEKLGYEKLMKLASPLSEYTASSRDAISMHRADLSYHHPSLTEANLFRHQQIYICKSGSEQQVIALVKEYLVLCKKHDVVSHFSIYTGVLGTEDYTIHAVYFGKDGATLQAQQAAIQKKMGKELEVLLAKIRDITVRQETRNGWYMPELSFIPAK